jgi:hypothetical protein
MQINTDFICIDCAIGWFFSSLGREAAFFMDSGD